MDATSKTIRNFLKVKEDRFAILQLKRIPELERFHFTGISELKKLKKYDKVVKPENYELKYMADFENFPELNRGTSSILGVLENIFTKFNVNQPEDFTGHSLSVGDIVLIHKGGVNSAYYVDSFGHTSIEHFLKELEKRVNTPQKVWYLGNSDRHVYFCVIADTLEEAKQKARTRSYEIHGEASIDFNIAEEFNSDTYGGVLCFD